MSEDRQNNCCETVASYPGAMAGHYPDWDAATAQEKQILLRVENSALSRYDETLGHVKTKQATRVWPFAFGLSLATTAAAALLLVVWTFSRPVPKQHPRVMNLKGTIPIETIASKNDTRPVDLVVPWGSSALLVQKHRFEIKAAGGTTFRLLRLKERSSLFRIQKGRMDIHVHPGKMRQFIVACPGKIQVFVKGTRFSVEQKSRWLRVEVRRGKVQINRASQASLLLEKGEGLRITTEQKAPQRYQLPPKQLQKPKNRMIWLAKHDPVQLYLYAQDLGLDPERPVLQRKEWLEQAANLLHGHKMFLEASHLWFQIASLDLPAENQETALLAAAQSCHLAKTSAPFCSRLFRQYLQRYPAGVLRDQVLLWLEQTKKQQTKK